jgi:hypothetical protein
MIGCGKKPDRNLSNGGKSTSGVLWVPTPLYREYRIPDNLIFQELSTI